jgi:hypothetical protein
MKAMPMAQFVGTPNVEVNGETVYAIVDGMGIFKSLALEVLAENGIVDPRPGEWFSQQKWLDAFKIISEKLGTKTLFAIGLKIPENAIFPSDIKTIEQALQAIDVAYHMNHRNGDIGEYRFESNGPKSAKMICRNPYPCAFDRGIITAMVKRFKPQNSLSAAVTHDDTAPCRVNGDESCTYLVNW